MVDGTVHAFDHFEHVLHHGFESVGRKVQSFELALVDIARRGRDDGEGLVEFVGDTGGHFAHRDEASRLEELHFEFTGFKCVGQLACGFVEEGVFLCFGEGDVAKDVEVTAFFA